MGKDESNAKNEEERVSIAILQEYVNDFGEMKSAPFPGGKQRPFNNELRVFFEKKVYDDIIEHSFQDDRIELGGVLIGDVKKDDWGAYLHVIANIRGKYSDSTISQVTFTHETWNYINDVKDKEYGDKKIVGWYHTHPRFGVFLSEMDIFIHENFFGKPYQIAMVVDPIGNSEGCFIKIQRSISLVKRFWVEKNEHKSTQDKSEREILLERVTNLETLFKEYYENMPQVKEKKESGIFGGAFLGWAAAFMLLMLLILNIFLGKSGGASMHGNEMLIATQDVEERGIQLRIYAAPLIKPKGVIIGREKEGVKLVIPGITSDAASPEPDETEPSESPGKK